MRNYAAVARIAAVSAIASMLSCASGDDACEWLAAELERCGEPMEEVDVAACSASLEPCTKAENRALVAFFDCVAVTSGSAFCGTQTTGAYADFVESAATCSDQELSEVSDACVEAAGYGG